MMFQIVNTTDWTYEQLAPYGEAVTAAMRQLEERFPDDVTVKQLAHECLTGARQLWLILDQGGGEFVSFCCTSSHTIEGTGKKVVTLTSHAGALGLDCCDDMCRVIEAWAWEQGADMTAVEGRRGWARALAKNGYREYAVIFRKPRPAEEVA